MSKRGAGGPGVFTTGLKKRHYAGNKALARRAEIARQRRIRWLRRVHRKSKLARDLAKRLEKCRPGHRCHSGACPVCAQAAQELFVEIVRALKDKGGKL